MRLILNKTTLAAMLTAVALLGLGTTSAEAQGHGRGFYGGGYRGHGGGDYGGGSYYGGGGYAGPSYQYYGNGGHDYQPHWHTRQTPFGNYSYYGLAGHDFRPHGHVETPHGVTSYSNGYFSSTQSYSPPAYVYRPW